MMLLIAGVCSSASAQAPASSLPSLPRVADANGARPATIPSLPASGLPSLKPTLPTLPNSTAASAITTTLPALPKVGAGVGKAPEIQGSAEPITLNVKTEAQIIAENKKNEVPAPKAVPTLPDVEVDSRDEDLEPPKGLPALPLPGQQAAQLPLPPTTDATQTLDFSSVQHAAKPHVKTWKTSLAPTSTPPTTNFNYKRHLLSQVVYKKEYDKYNSHLPVLVTREDYANLLFNSVANDDLDATRALLNAGVSLKATNPYGETPLTLAKRLGATQVAALLEARGAM